MKLVLLGASGMVGSGVLKECIDDSRVSEILIINPSSISLSHTKMKEIIHKKIVESSNIYTLSH